MLKAIFTLFIFQALASTAAHAQTSVDSNKQFSLVMQNGYEALKLQECLKQIDSADLDDFLRRGEHTKTQIETLCANNDRAGAKDLAVTFVGLYSDNSVAQNAKKCSELAPSLIPQFSVASFDGSLNGRHICDL